jgi:hypothetical protein
MRPWNPMSFVSRMYSRPKSHEFCVANVFAPGISRVLCRECIRARNPTSFMSRMYSRPKSHEFYVANVFAPGIPRVLCRECIRARNLTSFVSRMYSRAESHMFWNDLDNVFRISVRTGSSTLNKKGCPLYRQPFLIKNKDRSDLVGRIAERTEIHIVRYFFGNVSCDLVRKRKGSKICHNFTFLCF